MYVCMVVVIQFGSYIPYCNRSFGNKTIVFYETKKDAHRFCKVYSY